MDYIHKIQQHQISFSLFIWVGIFIKKTSTNKSTSLKIDFHCIAMVGGWNERWKDDWMGGWMNK